MSDHTLPLKTPRLEIREFTADDFPALHACTSDPLVTRFFSWGPNTESETREFLERVVQAAPQRPREHYVFAVVLLGYGLIGGCFLDRRRDQEFEIGYYLRRDCWNQGLATEAAGALVPFGFRDLGAHRLYARVDPENPASARVLESIGFRLEGEFRSDTLNRGEWRDSLIYALLAEEWRAAQQGR